MNGAQKVKFVGDRIFSIITNVIDGLGMKSYPGKIIDNCDIISAGLIRRRKEYQSTQEGKIEIII